MHLFKKFLPPRINGFHKIKKFIKNKHGIEIGGPSAIFAREKYIPVYPLIERLDGVNFSTNTIWENTIIEGATYHYDIKRSPGYQYIKEGADLDVIPDGTYDFVLSSHNLEHMANPIKALKEWLRILKKGGIITAILPDKIYTFDHKRPITTFEHLLDDYQKGIGEDDLTHVEEILSLHDRDMDVGLIDKDHFAARCAKNIDNRCLHHHVFDMDLLKEIYTYLDLKVILTDSSTKFNHIIVGVKH